MVLIAFLHFNIGIGTIWGSFSVLLAAVEARSGIDRTASTLGILLVTLVSAVLAPVMGVLLRRQSLRAIAMIGLSSRWCLWHGRSITDYNLIKDYVASTYGGDALKILQLVYLSIVHGDLPITAVRDIIVVSRHNNADAGITGLLLYDGRRFLQALEGESSAIERTYGRIKQDVRHRAMVSLSRKEVNERSFGDWAMAAELFNESTGTVIDQVDALTAAVCDPNLREHFRSFARLQRPEMARMHA